MVPRYLFCAGTELKFSFLIPAGGIVVSTSKFQKLVDKLNRLGMKPESVLVLPKGSLSDPKQALEAEEVASELSQFDHHEFHAFHSFFKESGENSSFSTLTSTSTRPTGGGVLPHEVAAKLPVKENGKSPKMLHNLPQVEKLLETHGYDLEKEGPAKRPFERVLVHAAKVYEKLLSAPTEEEEIKLKTWRTEQMEQAIKTDALDERIELMMVRDLRRYVFLLEGIARLYSPHSDAAKKIDWSEPRVVCIASDFTRYDQHAVKQMAGNIELLRCC